MKINQIKQIVYMSASLFLLGCGGDGSSTPSTAQSLIPSEFSIATNGLEFTTGTVIEVKENQKNAINVDAKTKKGKTLTYSIYGTDADKFNIDRNTGLATFKEIPDYEIKKIYYFTVKVSDENTELSQDITVIIKNINDTAPTIISSAANIINEKQKLAIDVDATDADEGDVLTYTISGTDAKNFNIDGITGIISFVKAPDYNETKYLYTCTALVSDGTNKTSQDITITIRDPKVNNNVPVFTSAATVNVEENQKSAITLTATDKDGHTLTYSISGIDAENFEVDSTTGVVTFKEAPDYEDKTEYTFTAKVSDGIEEVIQDVVVTIINISDTAPTITSSATATVAENQTSAITIMAEDADGDTLTYSISREDASYFNIDSSTGVVTFKTAPDYETKDSYSFIATVSDGQETTEDARQEVTITITNVNDGTPSINTPNAVDVKEKELFVIDVDATDPDGDTLTYTISDTDTFNINETTGRITFSIAPDYESGKINYNPTVTVSDGENNATQLISITITDDESDNNNAPVITSEATATVVENETTAIKITATDEDEGDTLTYSISGEDAADFDINSTSGVVTFKTAPDYETKTSYGFTATVSDGNATTEDATQKITIMITDDESDNTTNVAPTFTSSTIVEVEENQLSAIDIDATDADGDTLTYSISGEDAGSFDIDSTSGVVTFKEEPDYETKDSYSFIATVRDGNATTEDATQDITITITDVDEDDNVEENNSTQEQAPTVDIDTDNNTTNEINEQNQTTENN